MDRLLSVGTTVKISGCDAMIGRRRNGSGTFTIEESAVASIEKSAVCANAEYTSATAFVSWIVLFVFLVFLKKRFDIESKNKPWNLRDLELSKLISSDRSQQ